MKESLLLCCGCIKIIKIGGFIQTVAIVPFVGDSRIETKSCRLFIFRIFSNYLMNLSCRFVNRTLMSYWRPYLAVSKSIFKVTFLMVSLTTLRCYCFVLTESILTWCLKGPIFCIGGAFKIHDFVQKFVGLQGLAMKTPEIKWRAEKKTTQLRTKNSFSQFGFLRNFKGTFAKNMK